MDFIINHSGFFFGILLIVILAVIGYFADKKDNDKKKNIEKKSNSDDKGVGEIKDNVDNASLFNELPVDLNSNVLSGSNDVDLNTDADSNFNANNVSDLSSNGISDLSVNSPFENNVSNSSELSNNSSFGENSVVPFDAIGGSIDSLNNDINSSNSPDSVNNDINSSNSPDSVDSRVTGVENISFNSNDFESLDFSLEDLEKKNFDSIVKDNIQNDDDNYYYSNIDEGTSDISNSYIGDNSSLIDTDSSTDTVGSDTAVVSDVINSVDASVPELGMEGNASNIDSALGGVDILSNDDNDVESFEQDDNSHLFDNETQSDNHDDQFLFSSDSNEDIPELFESNSLKNDSDDVSSENSLSLDDQTTEDIWKF